MFQPVDQRHLRTHIMVGNLLQNFAHGVLGLRVSFDFAIALRQHERQIEAFVSGLFRPNNGERQRERPFTKDNIEEFKEYYREQITIAARNPEDEHIKNVVRNREDQARANAEVVRTMNNIPSSPSLDRYRPSPSPSRGNVPVSVPPSRDYSESRPTGLYTPALQLHGSMFNQQQVINTPQLTLNSVDRTTRVGMHNQVVDPTALTSILNSLQQQNAALNNLGSISPALYASQAN